MGGITREQAIAENIRRDFDAAGITDFQRRLIAVFMLIGTPHWPDDYELPPLLERYRQLEKRINSRSKQNV